MRITRDASRHRAAAHRAAVDRAGAAAGRLPAEGAARGSARQRVPVRADRPAGRARRHLHRARPRRGRGARPGRAGRGERTPRRIVAGVVSTPTARAPRGRHPRRAARRPDQVARRAVGAGVLARDRRARPRRADAACRSSGSRCRPARGSRWTPAPRTWTGSPPRSSGSSSSPRPAARSTSWSPGSTSARQPYWNAEATMLMHTKGILVMTPDSAMVLTGKQSLDFSGGVSAEDNFGIGGYDRVMGPNGQAQYWAPGLPAACDVLMAHYDHTYIAPGETAPRRAATDRPGGPRRLRLPARHGGQRLRLRRRDLLGRAQPGPQEAIRHPHGDAGAVRPGPPGARALGRDGRRGHRRWCRTCTSAAGRSA